MEIVQVKHPIFQREFSPIYLIILGIILVASVALWGAISFGYLENPLASFINKQPSQTIQTPQPIPQESSPSTKESSESAKVTRDLQIQILNGSGIKGQAGKLKSQLEDLGYENIETGNAEERTNTKTTVIFSKNVSNKDKDGITKELEITFEDVESKDQEDLEFDVIITTGSYK